MEHLTEQYRINEINLNLRNQFIVLSTEDIRLLKQLAGWVDENIASVSEENSVAVEARLSVNNKI